MKKITFLFILIYSTFIANCWQLRAAESSSKTPLQVGFLSVGPVSDWGFNYSTNKGRLDLEKKLGPKVRTVIAEKIPESAEAERVLEKMIASGCKLIFAASYGYLEPVMRVAKRHSDVVFMQINRDYLSNNVGNYYSNLYQPMYLVGMTAGRMTKTNHLGFIAAHPVPVLLQAINSFTLGAQSINPKIKTHVIWINNWSDPPMEADAVKILNSNGCDVIANAQDNQNTILQVCETAKIYCCGFYSDAHTLANNTWLTGACLDWGPFYTKIAQSVIDHTWKATSVRQGMEGGYIKLASFGHCAPKAVQENVLKKEEEIKSGRFIIFKGPIKNSEGKLKLKAGQNANEQDLQNMNWLVEGVIGPPPKD